MNTPLVSVVLPAYRVADFIGDALDSVFVQDYPKLEILVVDDVSPDNTVEVAENAFERAPRGVVCRLIRHEVNAGPGGALQTGFAAATGEYVCWLSSDDTWIGPSKVSRQLREMQSSGAGFSYYRDYLAGPSKSDASQIRSRMLPRPPFLESWMQASVQRVFTGMLLHNPVNGSSMMARLDTLERAGGFDPSVSIDSDGDLWLRVAALGERLHVVPEIGAFYRAHEGQLSQRASDSHVMASEVVRVRIIDALDAAGALEDVLRGAWMVTAGQCVLSRMHRFRPAVAWRIAHAITGMRSSSRSAQVFAEWLLKDLSSKVPDATLRAESVIKDAAELSQTDAMAVFRESLGR